MILNVYDPSGHTVTSKQYSLWFTFFQRKVHRFDAYWGRFDQRHKLSIRFSNPGKTAASAVYQILQQKVSCLAYVLSQSPWIFPQGSSTSTFHFRWCAQWKTVSWHPLWSSRSGSVVQWWNGRFHCWECSVFIMLSRTPTDQVPANSNQGLHKMCLSSARVQRIQQNHRDSNVQASYNPSHRPAIRPKPAIDRKLYISRAFRHIFNKTEFVYFRIQIMKHLCLAEPTQVEMDSKWNWTITYLETPDHVGQPIIHLQEWEHDCFEDDLGLTRSDSWVDALNTTPGQN